MRRKLAAGNWKMHGTTTELIELARLAEAHAARPLDIVICPPAPLLYRAGQVTAGTNVHIGAQDCHAATAGAHTGDVSAAMIADARASHVIVGHSERRAAHHETNEDVRAKTRAAWAAGLTAILCIGESASDRAAANTLDIIAGQLAGSIPDAATAANLVVAYEPIWAIGTGQTASLDQIVEVHDFIRARLTDRFGAEGAAMRLLYGGSVKPGNAAEIFSAENVDGALVGGASLTARDFSPIIEALAAA